jgi:hypothetical protein
MKYLPRLRVFLISLNWYKLVFINVTQFQFNDALVNGNMKSLMVFLQEVANYNINNPSQKLTWSAEWICRPKHQNPKNFGK